MSILSVWYLSDICLVAFNKPGQISYYINVYIFKANFLEKEAFKLKEWNLWWWEAIHMLSFYFFVCGKLMLIITFGFFVVLGLQALFKKSPLFACFVPLLNLSKKFRGSPTRGPSSQIIETCWKTPSNCGQKKTKCNDSYQLPVHAIIKTTIPNLNFHVNNNSEIILVESFSH